MKKRVRTLMLSLAVLLVVPLIGCESEGYLSEDYALYTVVANNFIGAGASVNETTHIIETDSYGRILFLYRNSGSVFDLRDALCICQAHDEKFAYYYEDDCIIFCDHDGNIPDELLTMFKQKNDWDSEMNMSKMSSAPIIRHIREKLEYSNSLIDAAADAIESSEGYKWESVILCADKYGRQLIIQKEYSYDNHDIGKTYAVIVPPDGVVDERNGIMEMDEDMLIDYTEAIKAFKARNGWNRPDVQ